MQIINNPCATIHKPLIINASAPCTTVRILGQLLLCQSARCKAQANLIWSDIYFIGCDTKQHVMDFQHHQDSVVQAMLCSECCEASQS